MNGLGGIRYGSDIAAAAAAYGLDPKLLAAVAAQETGGPGTSSGRNVVGDGGHGHGLFQIDDRSWAFAKTPAAMDPKQNAAAAAAILAGDLKRYGGDVHAALSAYNTGSPTATGTTTTWADGATLGYADSVLRHLAELSGPSAADLAAEQRTTSAGVNALATLSAGRGGAAGPSSVAAGLAPPVLAPATDPSAAANAASVPLALPLGANVGANALPAPQSPSTFTPIRSWTSLMPPASADADGSGSTADQGLAELVGGGDVFGSADDA